MKNLLEFESFDPINEASFVPIYNNQLYIKNPSIDPESRHQASAVVSAVKSLMDRMEDGEISKISVIADVPTQGKRAPLYIKDTIESEKRRIAGQMAREKGKEITDPEALDFDRYGNKRNFFFDSEFIVDGVIEGTGGKKYVIGIPESLYSKATRDEESRKYYSVEISPEQIEEIYYDPA
jgi:hypothetical protein